MRAASGTAEDGSQTARVHDAVPSRQTELSLLAALVLSSSTLGVALLKDGHAWGDDFAAYLMQAQSLLDGTMDDFVRRNAFTIERSAPVPGPVTYPWGYPLLLAPALGLLGLDLFALKLLSVGFFALFLVALHALLRLHLSTVPALLVVACFAFNPTLLRAQDHVLSDVPFLFFSSLALCAIERLTRSRAEARTDLAAGAVGAAILTATAMRLNGLLLLAVLATAQTIRFRTWPAADRIRQGALPYLTFGLLALAYSLLFPSGDTSYLGYYRGITSAALRTNFEFYAELPAWMLGDVPLHAIFDPLLEIAFVAGLLLGPLRCAPSAAYAVLLLAMLLPWPFTPVPRFFFPALPPLAVVAAEGGRSIAARLPPRGTEVARWTALGLAGALAVLSLVTSGSAAWSNLKSGRASSGPFDARSTEMFAFVRDETPPEAVVVFYKPRVLRLLTDRDAFRTTTCDGLRGGDFVVVHRGEPLAAASQVAHPETCAAVEPKPVFQNDDFAIFRVVRSSSSRGAELLRGP